MPPDPVPKSQVVDKEKTGPSSEQVGQGISAFLARVLDQLSVTSWLPALFLVGNVAVLFALAGKTELSLTSAIQQLVDLRWGAIVVLLFAVIIGAMIIQAFEFESLRFWEGYLRSPRLQKWAKRRICHFQGQRATLEQDCTRNELDAFDEARRRALDDKGTSSEDVLLWNAMEMVMHGRKLDPAEADLADRAAETLNWPSFADAALLHVWDISKLKLSEFPLPHRLLPTRLGNVMRAGEDHVKLGPDEDLEGFMIRHIDELPATIVSEHAAYRRRLEMYCGLMFVLGLLVMISVICVWGSTTGIVWRVLVPLAYVAAAWTCYRAAIASALGFGQALKEANRWVGRAQPALLSSSLGSDELH